MKTYPALILDDELPGRQLMAELLKRHLPQVQPVFTAKNIEEALQLATTKQPSIYFLDIEVDGRSGFELLSLLPAYTYAVIFTTAHQNYAPQAFRVHAADYLLKPIVVAELKDAVYNAIALLEQGQPGLSQGSNANPAAIAIPTMDGFKILRPADIIYCKASGNYTDIVLRNKGSIISSSTLGHFETQLTPYGFFRIHRSCLINLAEVVAYRKGEGGFIEMSDGMVAELSRQRKADFIALFKHATP